MNVFIGLDVSLRSVAMCVLSTEGDLIEETYLDCEVEAISDHIRTRGYSVGRIGFEAGTMSQALFHGLTAEGFDVVCMESRQVSAAMSAMRNKTDKTAARGIAQILRAGWYNPVHMKSRESHEVKALLAARKAILNRCIDLENEIRGLFKAAIDDPTRFKSSRLVGAHFGLTPRRFQSGEMDNTGRISRAGDRDVRATLYIAANSLLIVSGRPSSFKTWGLKLIRTKGVRRTRIAVARKLAVILHRMWITNTPFQTEGVL